MKDLAVQDDAAPTSLSAGRFQSLDSLRGICALMVVLFHFNGNGLIGSLGMARNGWVFVDFFLVLSGFVICHAYRERIASGKTSVGSFMALRMGRIYPLHFVVLAGFVSVEILKLATGIGADRPAFTGSYSVSAFAANLLLIQSFGLHDSLSWNGPAWSIAAEMWTYLLFAFLLAFFGKRGPAIFGGIGLLAFISLLFFADQGLNSTYDWGFVRCVFGFALGIGIQSLYARGVRIGGNANEIIAIVLVVAFISWLPEDRPDDRIAFVAPFLFAVTVLVFANGRGLLNRILNLRPLILLGTLSYSIYMVHLFVLARTGFVLKRIGGSIGVTVSADVPGQPEGVSSMVAPPLTMDLLTLAVLALVILISAITYTVVERPAREWTRSLVARRRNGGMAPNLVSTDARGRSE